jgi:acetyltransferase-like isoleucine patch superfamily enzyme
MTDELEGGGMEMENFESLMEDFGYNGVGGRIKLVLRYFFNYILKRLACACPINSARVDIHRLRGVNIGHQVYLGEDVEIDYMYPHKVTIGDFVSIGCHTLIFAHSNASFSKDLKKHYPKKIGTVIIGDGTWIAPGSIILSDVTIGKNCVIGAGSVVASDVEDNTVVWGVPARPVRRLPRE